MLAFREIFSQRNLRQLGLVTPYTSDVQERIMRNWSAAGVTCTAERHLGLSDNFSFAEVDERRVAELVREVAREGCEAVAVVCTNMRGARLAEALEAELGIPVYDFDRHDALEKPTADRRRNVACSRLGIPVRRVVGPFKRVLDRPIGRARGSKDRMTALLASSGRERRRSARSTARPASVISKSSPRLRTPEA